MELQNIGASNSDDAFYRYKMPKMITKVEDSGNGIKTNVVNMVDIAKALHRPASYTTKYFGCELGAESMFDEKTGTSLVNGAHDTAKLAGLLETFIKKYVQCYGCGNPETDIIITKTQMITLKCAACGFVSDVDMRDKLTTSILKNPPEQKRSSKDKKGIRRAEKEQLKEGEAADDEQKKVKEIKKKSRGIVSSKDGSKRVSSKIRHTAVRVKKHSSPPESQADKNEVDDNDDDDGVQLQTDTPAEAACQRIQEQLSAVTAEMVILSTDDVTNKDQKRKNHEKKEAAAKVEPEVTVRLSAHEMLILEIKGMLKGSKPCEVGSNLSSLVDSNQEKMNALFEALFEGVGKGFAKEVEKKKTYLAAVVQDEDEGSQMCLLRAIETFCRKCSVDAVKEVALVVKFLYDGDILEEEIIVKWYEEGLVGANKTSPVWKSIKPFVVCLPNAGFGSEEEY